MINIDQYFEYIALAAIIVSLFIGYISEVIMEYVSKRYKLWKKKTLARKLFVIKQLDASRKHTTDVWYAKLEEMENVLKLKGRY